MAESELSRRNFLERSAVIVTGSLLVACSGDNGAGGALNCTNTSDLTTSERSLRISLEYVDISPYGEEKNCSRCQFFQSASRLVCGRCASVKGPIHPSGYCTIWSPHPA